ncbi:MAG: putative HTH-type transcriptional regulator YvdT [candidate division WS2 bacterium]|nr:putative HTH-type transcriptional regulator YvdT [Candidatus Psychracetigena formicireducens]
MSRIDPKTSKGIKTRDSLVETATHLFYTDGYFQTSTHQIAQEAGMSTPSFYQYFYKKEDILFEIITTFSSKLFGRLKLSLNPEDGLEVNIRKFYTEYLTYLKINRKNYKIFRETEFVGYPYVKQYYSELGETLKSLLGRDIPDWLPVNEIIYNIIGSVYFVALKKIDWEDEGNIFYLSDELTRFTIEGINNRPDYKLKSNIQKTWMFSDLSAVPRKVSKSEETKRGLLRAAEKLIGQNGYDKTHISDITREAGVGQGTFYLYFQSKLDILKALVQDINKGLRFAVYQYIVGLSHRNDIEVGALLAFAEYIKNHRNAYRVVREAEFIDREIGKWYYNRIAKPYAIALKEAMTKGEINSLDPELLGLAIMGIGHVLGLRWVVWSESNNPAIPEESLRNALKIILFGVKGEES